MSSEVQRMPDTTMAKKRVEMRNAPGLVLNHAYCGFHPLKRPFKHVVVVLPPNGNTIAQLRRWSSLHFRLSG